METLGPSPEGLSLHSHLLITEESLSYETAPQFPQQPQPQTQPYREDPGQTLSIVSLVLIVILPLAGMICGIVGRNKSREAGFDGKLGQIGFIINLILTILGAVWIIFALLAVLTSTPQGAVLIR